MQVRSKFLLLAGYSIATVLACCQTSLADPSLLPSELKFRVHALDQYIHVVKDFRDQSPESFQIGKTYFGDLTLLEREIDALKVHNFTRAEMLNNKYLEIIRGNGVIRRLKNHGVHLHSPRGTRWATLRYLAAVDPSQVTRFASLEVFELGFLLARNQIQGEAASQDLDQLRISITNFAKWLRHSPIGAADYLLQRRIFEFLVGQANESYSHASFETAHQMRLQLEFVIKYFESGIRRDKHDRITPNLRMHRWPRGALLALGETRAQAIQEESQNEMTNIWIDAAFQAADRVSLVLSVTGLGLMARAGFTIGEAFMIGLKVYQAANLISGISRLRDSFAAARSGDDTKMGFAFANTVLLATLGLGKPLAAVIGFSKTASGNILQVETSDLIRRLGANGNLFAKGLVATEGLSKWTYRSFVVMTQATASGIHLDRYRRAKEIANQEGRTERSIQIEEATMLFLRSLNIGIRGADWSQAR